MDETLTGNASREHDGSTERMSSQKNSGDQLFSVVVNVLATFVVSVAMGMCAILFPVTMQHNGISESVIGGVMSLETIASLVICFLLGPLLRYVGMRVGLVVATGLRVVALAALAFSNTLPMWFAAVFLHGFGAFTFLLLLQTWVNSIPFKRNKGLMVALYSTAISLGLAAGPVLLNYSLHMMPVLYPVMATVTGWFGIKLSVAGAAGAELVRQYKFLLAALISLLALVPVLMGIWTIPRFEFSGKAGVLKTVMKAKGPMFAIATGGVSIFGVTAFITLYGLRNHLSLEDSALLLTSFMLGSLMLETPLAWISDYFDRRYVIVACAFLGMICAVLLPITIYVAYQAWILLFVWGGVVGALYSTSLALIGEKFTGDELIAANAGYSMMDAAGGTVGILMIGTLMQVLPGPDGLPYTIMLASILYFSFALTRYRVV